MNRLTLSLPAILVAAGIIVFSRILDGTPFSPWFHLFKAVEIACLMVLFSFLGFFASRYLRTARATRGLECMILSTAVCLMFAVFNEWHQSLDPAHRADFHGLVRTVAAAFVGSVLYLAWSGARHLVARSVTPGGAAAGHSVLAVPLAVLITLAVVAYWDQPVSLVRTVIGQQKVSVRSLATVGGGEQRVSRQTNPLPEGQVGAPNPAEEPPPGMAYTPPLYQAAPDHALQDVSQRIKGQLVQEALNYLSASGKPGGTEESLASAVTRFVAATSGATLTGKNISSSASRPEQPLAGHRGQTGQVSVPVANFGQAPVAVIVNPSNPVSDLTLEQARKLISGEYSNWSQVGGPDLAVKVLLVGHPKSSEGSPERVLNVVPASNARRLKYVSFIFPHVDRNKGAVAFVPLTTMGQVDVLGQHTVLKMVAVKDAPGSTALIPTQEAIRTGSYPMVAQQRLSDYR